MILLAVLINIVLPVFIIIGAGFVAARMLTIDAHTLSRVSLYVLGPCLVFSKLVETTVTGTDLVQIVVFTVVGTLLVLALSWVVARSLRLDRSKESAFMLSCTFVNSGNYGLPLVLFAFGEQGLDRALLYFVTSAFVVNTLAVFVASRGKAKSTASLLNIFRIPIIGQGMKVAGFIPVDRKRMKGGKKSIEEAARQVKEKGLSFLIFPEGTRSRDGRLQPFKRGGFFLALDSQASIVPISIQGTYELMPRKSFFAKKGKIKVLFHAPHPVKDYDRQTLPQLIEVVRDTIKSGLKE